MMRFWIIAAVSVVVCLALAGCTQQAGSSSPGPTDRTAPSEKTRVTGAAAAQQDDYSLQKSAKAVHPSPPEAKKKENRPQMYADGCHLPTRKTKSSACVYANPSSKTTVVLFGDSHAMQWFPALNKLAKERDWRLVGLTKSACPPAKVHRYNARLRREYRECDQWRKRTLERITQKENPSLIVTSMLNRYRAWEDGKRLPKKASNEAVIKGYVSTLQKLRSTGARIAVIEDSPRVGKDIPECVSHSLDDLPECAFPRSKAMAQPRFNARAASEVERASLIDATPMICPGKMCPAVIGDVLVYRNGSHLTATYVLTLTPWLAEHLPEPAGS